MPKNKKGATGGSRGRGRGKSFGQQAQRHVYSDDDPVDFIPFGGGGRGSGRRHGQGAQDSHQGFSLASEARHTPTRHNWSSDTKLRNVKINFVSAGPVEPAKSIESDSEPEQSAPEPTVALADMSLDAQPIAESTPSASTQQDTPAETEDDTADLFMVDTIGAGQPIQTRFSIPQIRSSSPTPSDSSEDVILFTGRDNSGRGTRRATPPRVSTRVNTYSDPYEKEIKTIDHKIHEQERLLAETMGAKDFPPFVEDSNPIAISIEEMREVLQGEEILERPPNSNDYNMETVIVEVEDTPEESFTPIRHPRATQRRNSRKARLNEERQTRKELKDAEEQALIDDYIANMEDEEMGELAKYNRRDLGGEDDDIWEETDASAVAQPEKGQKTGDWSREELCDFDDLSTSDGVMESIQVILSKRERKLGVQYLVVWEEQSVDEARWHYHASLPTDQATTALVEGFEAEEKLIAEFLDGEDDSSDEDSDDMDGTDGHPTGESDDQDDDADLIQRKIDRMTDEKIARLLAKQEELGMGSDEIMLFDDDDDDDGLDDLSAMFMAVKPKRQRGMGQQRRKEKIRGPNTATGHFPKATDLADAYDGFDVMDFERPSLKKKPKGRKGKLILDDISDSELEESMQMAWENDRMKKKERKEEREELRAAGLLGKKNKGKPDMSARYKEGMGIDAVRDEIRDFLRGGNTTLALPPMDKGDRKIVHEIASAFNLKSKSAGNGTKRFPVLYRTQRTREYREAIFTSIEARFTSKRFLPRMDLKGKKPVASGRAGRGGGFSSSAVGYRDGDVVGASAPEIGIENKGRKMLEMMGWNSGDALGALNNKGILQPVSHVVKTTKAGLG